MKYVILIHSNPQSRELWASFPAEEKVKGLAVYSQLVDDLVASGELIVTEALADPALGRRLPPSEGFALDGPFAEAKEQLAGFFLVECPSIDRAIEIAERVPEAGLGLVEVRPVATLEDLAS